MKNVVLIAVLAGALGGIATTVVNKLTEDAPSAEAQDTRMALSPSDAGSTGALESRIAKLQKENDALAIRLATLETRSNSAREAVPVSGAEAQQNISELQAQVLELAMALKNPQSAQSAGLRNMVAVAMQEVDEMDAKERELEREQRDIDRIIERMEDYSTKLGLDAVQRSSMQATLIDANKKRTELWTSMRDGTADRDQIRTTMTTMRDEVNAKLGTILTPTQLETYIESENDGRFGGFGGDRGGRGGRGN